MAGYAGYYEFELRAVLYRDDTSVVIKKEKKKKKIEHSRHWREIREAEEPLPRFPLIRRACGAIDAAERKTVNSF